MVVRGNWLPEALFARPGVGGGEHGSGARPGARQNSLGPQFDELCQGMRYLRRPTTTA